MEYTFLFFLSQLVGQAPMLLAYVVGTILALVFWRRCPLPAKLTLLGLMLLLITSLVQSFLVSYFVQARVNFDWSHQTVGLLMSVTGLVGSLIRAAAFSLILIAVFIGRKTAQVSSPIEALPLMEPASRGSFEHGITRLPGT